MHRGFRPVVAGFVPLRAHISPSFSFHHAVVRVRERSAHDLVLPRSARMQVSIVVLDQCG
jgi:hypothetical protein